MAIVGQPLWSTTAVVTIAEAETTVTTSTTLEKQTSIVSGNALTSLVKDISIKFSPRALDIETGFGYGNQYITEKAPEMTEVTCTLVGHAQFVSGVPASAKDIYQLLYGAGSAVSTSYLRIQGGTKSTGDRTTKAFLFTNFNAATNTYITQVLLNNVRNVDIERSLATGEQEEFKLTFQCLSQDTYTETRGITT